MGSRKPLPRPFPNKVLIALLVVFGLLAFLGPALFFRMARAEPMTVAEFEAARAGAPAQVVGEVLDAGAEGFRFEVLEGRAEELRRTGVFFEARGADYKVSLGSREDVRPGAIVIVAGAKRDDRTIAPAMVLILTDKVPRPREGDG